MFEDKELLDEVISTLSGIQFDALKATSYFERYRDVKYGGNCADDKTREWFRVYEAGEATDAGPILLLLHGGGYSSLTWALFTKSIRQKVTCAVIAVDLRAHGSTQIKDELDLSIETLSNDLFELMKIVNASNVPVVIVGHSLGGALAINVADLNLPNVVAVCVIDVVEDLALRSLYSMPSIIKNRPSHFVSMSQAILWALKSGLTKNKEAAQVSIPGQIYK